MSRHSKSVQIREFFTSAERAKWNGIGTTQTRLGADSMRAYDACCLCLQLAQTPMATPAGYLYCKECIYSNILEQRQAYERKLKEYTEQRSKEDEKERTLKQMQDQLETEVFLEQHHRVLPTTSKDHHLITAVKKEAIKALSEEGTEGAKPIQQNFWIPQHTPSYKADQLQAPESRLVDPMDSEQPLKVKRLVECKFMEQRELQTARQSGGEGAAKANIAEGKFHCPSCCRTLSNAIRLCVLPTCGHVICTPCVEKFTAAGGGGEPAAKKAKREEPAAASYTCIVCSKPCKRKEIIFMQPPGTGFCAALTDPTKQVATSFQSANGNAAFTTFDTQAVAQKLRLKV
nr:Nitric oxide synthase-interacting protein [Euglena gracilis]